MTLLEMMIVIAIMGGASFLLRSAFRGLTKADLVEDATELTALLRRTAQLAIEHGELHRVLIDLDRHVYVVEACQGQAAIVRNERLDLDPEETKAALERGKQRLQQLPSDAFAAGDPDEATKRAIAISGHHVADRMCAAATDAVTGDASGKGQAELKDNASVEDKAAAAFHGWSRSLEKTDRGDPTIKFKEVWVQHRDEGQTEGQVAIYFFPTGSSEKAVIELTDGDETFSILVHGLTGRVELRDGALGSVDDHMLRNVMGDKDARRDGIEQ